MDQMPEGLSFSDPLVTLEERLDVPGLNQGDIASLLSAYEDGIPMVSRLHDRLVDRSGR
jgi:hypothetical protein